MEMLFDKTVDTKRLTDILYTDTEVYVDYLENVSCNIQPLEDTYSQDFDGNYGLDFLMFCSDNDIDIKDKIVYNNSEYIVVGKESYSLLGKKHLELRIRLTK
jgi:hypothetical protein